MEVFDKIKDVKRVLKEHKNQGKTIGLVPTMGALHGGHMSLMDASLNENDITVCSIFVNPIQFNNNQDLIKYPRDFERDRNMLEDRGCDILFSPENDEIYPIIPIVKMSFGQLEKTMEGAFREGHFNGVGTVVSKLFNIIEPDRAYFGQKDLQQFLIIQQLVSDLNFNTELRCIPIARESDGLAISSRNIRLTEDERALAHNLYKALELGKEILLLNSGIEKTKNEVFRFLAQWEQISLEYFEVVNGRTLDPIAKIDQSESVALCIAAYVGQIRLIDNMFLFS
ncbi:pantoate--beta-alanine ligase [Fulvivirgaceae bacterium BMA10]|uniref:Pantothenate synthetase n=1 Tax=Splendidivirga corallicola TaxID=3051826 RepID=A0ABT8KT76_9BACT|nr:pantoate--beta-alanine ligase [Fulvivirgaceae bacterium BMA10]